MTELRGWTDHPIFKLLSPLISAAIIAAVLFWGNTAQTITKIEMKLSDLCVDMEEFKRNAKALDASIIALATARELTNYRLMVIEERLKARELKDTARGH